jgi:hypothetical protein
MSDKELIDKLKQIVADFEAKEPEIPEGWTRWDATKHSEWTGHPEDVVDVMYRMDHITSGEGKAKNWNWGEVLGTFVIIAYKIVKKYEEPKAVNPWFFPKEGDVAAYFRTCDSTKVLDFGVTTANAVLCNGIPYLRPECAEAWCEAENELLRFEAMGEPIVDGVEQWLVDDLERILLCKKAAWKMCFGAVFKSEGRLIEALEEFGGIDHLQKMRLQRATGRKV